MIFQNLESIGMVLDLITLMSIILLLYNSIVFV